MWVLVIQKVGLEWLNQKMQRERERRGFQSGALSTAGSPRLKRAFGSDPQQHFSSGSCHTSNAWLFRKQMFY